MLRLGVIVGIAVAMLASGASADPSAPLQANVGPTFTISLRDAAGNGISHLDPGTYTVHVVDQSPEHDFHLTGPGVDKATDVEGVGEQDWTVTLTDGTYNYICDVHATTMHGTFTVGTVTPPPPPPPPPPLPIVQRMSGSVGPGSKIAFTKTAKAGKAVLTIRDRSPKDNFHLTGPGVNKKTGVAATGTFVWNVTLKAGTYVFRSDAHTKLEGSTKVS